jgi:hypothetical protein
MENCHGTLLEKSSLAREALKALVERRADGAWRDWVAANLTSKPLP